MIHGWLRRRAAWGSALPTFGLRARGLKPCREGYSERPSDPEPLVRDTAYSLAHARRASYAP